MNYHALTNKINDALPTCHVGINSDMQIVITCVRGKYFKLIITFFGTAAHLYLKDEVSDRQPFKFRGSRRSIYPLIKKITKILIHSAESCDIDVLWSDIKLPRMKSVRSHKQFKNLDSYLTIRPTTSYREIKKGALENILSYQEHYTSFLREFSVKDPTFTTHLFKYFNEEWDEYYFMGHNGTIRIRIHGSGGEITDEFFGTYPFKCAEDMKKQLGILFERIRKHRRLKNLFDPPNKFLQNFINGHQIIYGHEEKSLYKAFYPFMTNDELEEFLVDAKLEPVFHYDDMIISKLKQFMVLTTVNDFYLFQHKEEAFSKLKEIAHAELHDRFENAFEMHKQAFESMVI